MEVGDQFSKSLRFESFKKQLIKMAMPWRNVFERDCPPAGTMHQDCLEAAVAGTGHGHFCRVGSVEFCIYPLTGREETCFRLIWRSRK
jgi:hypothetical protein